MKRTITNSPNQRLKSERELRGWSQKYVAEQIGAEPYYLSRWERGAIFPSPYYRQKLCDLFGKNARELGVLQEESGSTRETSHGSHVLSESTPGMIYDPAIPLAGLDATALVGRTELLTQLSEQLCSGKNLILTALNGIPGIGKTALAITLAHNDDVHAHFHDGVLWAGMGPTPHVLGLLSRWGSLLGVTNADAANLTSVEAWTQIIRSTIGTRRMLLILDDVWEIEEALALKVGGPRCAYIATTRFPQIALRFAAEGVTLVQELNERDSVALLERLAPAIVKSEPTAIDELVRIAGGLPLALTLIGKYLRVQGHSGQPRRIRAALEALRDVEVRLHLSEPQALLEYTASLPDQTPVSLQAVIAMSVEQMDAQARKALAALAVFPTKPNTFSEESALAVCLVPVETLDALSDAGILESRGPGRYTLHQTIADYARTQLTDTAPFECLATYFADYVQAHEQDDDLLEVESNNIFAALQAAFEQKRHEELVRCVHAFVRFLQARGLYEQAVFHLKRAYQSAHALQDFTAVALTLCYLGEIAEIRSELDQAEKYLLEGLDLARQYGDQGLISRLLQPLGFVVGCRGEYVQAEAYLQEGLALALQCGNQARRGTILRLLGRVVGDQGNFTQAEAYLQESLLLARENGDAHELTKLLTNLGYWISYQGDNVRAEMYWQEGLILARQSRYRRGIASLLINLGCLEYERGNGVEAQKYWETCLPVTRQIGDQANSTVILMNLGTLASDRGDYEEAEAYLQESLNQARQNRDHLLICSALNNWGECQLKQQRWETASEAFQDLQALSAKGNRQNTGVALYGLARIDFALGNHDEAYQKGRTSLTIFEDIKYFRLEEVRQWLSGLSAAPGNEGIVNTPGETPDTSPPLRL